MLLGAVVYYAIDRIIEDRGGDRPGIAASGEEIGNGPAIVIGAVLDGIPESFVLGLTVVSGEVDLALMAAIFVSNFPEGLASSASLAEAGWARRTVIGMWVLIALVSGSRGAGRIRLLRRKRARRRARAGLRGGAILAMLAEAMMPDGFKFGGRLAGVVTVLGFIAGIGLNSLQ